MIDTIRVMLTGKLTLQNRFGVFQPNEVREFPRAIGEAILKYQGFQEEVQAEEKEKIPSKSNKKGGGIL